MNGDTIINSINYQKIFFEILEEDNGQSYIGGLREDDNKNIYFFPSEAIIETPTGHIFPNNTEEHLIYSFNNLSIGMELPINEENTSITVQSIDSVLIGDTYRKSYHLYNDMLLGYDYWIEGIGSTRDFLSSYTYVFEWDFWTLCMTNENGEIFYVNSPNGEDSCHYYINVGIDGLKISNAIYPNPVKNQLHIEISIENLPEELIILNIQGRAIIRKKLTDQKTTIDLSELESGIYLLELFYHDKKEVFKLIKE